MYYLLKLSAILVAVSTLLYSQNFTLEYNNFEIGSIADITSKDESKAILGYYEEELSSSFYIPKIFLNSNGNWNQIEVKIENGNETNYVFATPTSMIRFDSTNSIWVSGFEIYRYNGEKWKAFSIKDDDFEDRTYQQFVVDKFNNLWITTRVFNKETKLGKSELLKLEGDEFIKVLEFPTPFSFIRRGIGTKGVSLSTINGKIFVQRTLDSYEQDVIDENYEDLYIFNQDLSYERIRLKTPSNSTTNGDVEWNKNLVQIYPEDENKIWFCYDIQGNAWKGELCCSGMSLLKNDNWVLFDEKFNFPKKQDDLFTPIYRILKLQEGGYLIVGQDIIFKMDSNFNITELDWYDIVNNSTIVAAHSYYNNEIVGELINGLIDNEIDTPEILTLYQEKNGDICFHFQFGIIKVNNKVMSVDDNNSQQSVGIYPNPVQDQLRINNYEIGLHKNIEIYNVLSEKVLTANISENNSINVSNLTPGIYFIKIGDKMQKFVKE